jgi:hypothetical protein
MPKTHIGSPELTDAVKELLHIFEIPLHIARKGYMEDMSARSSLCATAMTSQRD